MSAADETTTPDSAVDLAEATADLYHRCYNDLNLPDALAQRIAGDFYQAMAREAARAIWQESPRARRWAIRKLGVL